MKGKKEHPVEDFKKAEIIKPKQYESKTKPLPDNLREHYENLAIQEMIGNKEKIEIDEKMRKKSKICPVCGNRRLMEKNGYLECISCGYTCGTI